MQRNPRLVRSDRGGPHVAQASPVVRHEHDRVRQRPGTISVAGFMERLELVNAVMAEGRRTVAIPWSPIVQQDRLEGQLAGSDAGEIARKLFPSNPIRPGKSNS